MTPIATRKWVQVTMPAEFNTWWRKEYPTVPAPIAHESGPLRAFVGREPVAEGDHRWHISVARGDRLPTWDEIVISAHDLRPGVPFAVPVPPRSWWVNVHRFVLHMWEVKDPHLVNMWRQESRGDRPT
jgi:hypothetical protein